MYDLRVNSLRHVIAFTLSLVVAIVVVAIVGGGNKAHGAEDLRCHAGDDGDHAGALEMEIEGTKKKRLYHVTDFITACDEFILSCILFCFDVIATVAL